MSRRTFQHYQRLKATGLSSEQELDRLVTRFFRSRNLEGATNASGRALTILQAGEIPLQKRLEEIEYLISRPDAPDGAGSIFQAPSNRQEQMTSYMRIQEALLDMACILLQDTNIPNWERYLKAETILDEIPTTHAKHSVIDGVMKSIELNDPGAVHLCPYRHGRMSFDEALISLQRPHIPYQKRFDCLMGMMAIAKEDGDTSKQAVAGDLMLRVAQRSIISSLRRSMSPVL